jgi:hypothetical protein
LLKLQILFICLMILMFLCDFKPQFLLCNFLYYTNVLVSDVSSLDSCIVASESIFWFRCGVPFKVFLCYVL